MNKNRLILVILGGIIGLALLVTVFLDWSAYSAKTAALEGDEEEGTDGLETVVSKAQQLSRKPIYPCAKSVKEIAENETKILEWKEEAIKLASRGDRPVKVTTPAQFKTDMVAEAKRLINLPGAVQGKLAKEEFTFGPFKEYIVEGKMPSESDLKRLTRQWDDVVGIIEALSASGVAELTGIEFKAQEAPKEEETSRKSAKKGKKEKKVEATFAPSAFGYVFTFTTRPLGFVKTINALETCERFTVVEDFAFTRGKDVIALALGGDEKKNEATSGGRRGRRRRLEQVEEQPATEALKNGIIADPLLDEPFTVTLSVTVYDFGSMNLNEEKTEEEK